jgi:hypothetical protein
MSKIVDVVVTAPEAAEVKCPYTGKRMEVHMVVQPGSVVFSAPDAFTLSEPVGTMEELLLRASMRNGMTGSVPKGATQRCPYTGKTLRIREMPDGRVCFVGGFNPRAGSPSLGEFLYYATMRDGVPTRNRPECMKAERPSQVRYLKKKDVQPSQATMEVAERVAEESGLFQKKSMVTAGVRLKGGKAK